MILETNQQDPHELTPFSSEPNPLPPTLLISFSPSYIIPNITSTRCDWFNILYIAIYWGFGEIERLTMQQIEFIDNHLNIQQSSVQVTRRLPSPTNTKPMPDSGDEGTDMYVEESQ